VIAAGQPRSSPDVLGRLLHSLCQPLTSLRCSLELSLDESIERQEQNIAVALEQADRAIESVQLIREYLELERAPKPVQAVPVRPVVDAVLCQLSVVAEAHHIPLLASGTTTATLYVNEFWLQRALRYLIGTWLQGPVCNKAVVVVMEDGASESSLSTYCLSSLYSDGLPSAARAIAGHLQQARLAIAQRVLESAGASVELSPDGKPAFVIRIPHAKTTLHKLSA